MSVEILTGDCRDVLKTLPDDSVHCVVTSPPYWGLRDYDIQPSWWGGDPACEHEAGEEGRGTQRLRNGEGTYTAKQAVPVTLHPSTGAFCARCDAWLGSLGLEPTYALYVAHMVDVFREVRRVLRPDGTLWLNLGDSYASGGRSTYRSGASDNKGHLVQNNKPRPKDADGTKPKDLLGIPWRVAFALQADGWWLRQDIIWHKPNPMPESVRDRCTKAHEYIFLMTKSARYHFDADAIAEPSVSGHDLGLLRGKSGVGDNDGVAWHAPSIKKRQEKNVDSRTAASGSRNKRSVWTIPSAPFPGAHFATFPPALVEPCILAGCPIDGTILDPFGGAGTTGLVADRLGRDAILIDLNSEYANMARQRLSADAPLFDRN